MTMNYRTKNMFIAAGVLAIGIGFFALGGWTGELVYLGTLAVVEVAVEVVIDRLREQFQWLITRKKDLLPRIDRAVLKKFIADGFDPELGWVRKPNTEHEEKSKAGRSMWHTDAAGARKNPGFDGLPSTVSCYGDSFTFSRQVNDDETWPFYLSGLTRTNVINWGIGNHGLDQSLLRLKREYRKHPTRIVLVGVVPDTISRILSRWKHFYEYGNTFGFKPRFILDGRTLTLLDNPVDTEEKFLALKELYPEIAKGDYFYGAKFLDEMISFPYVAAVLRNLGRNARLIAPLLARHVNGQPQAAFEKAFAVIMQWNLRWRLRLYKQREAVELLEALVDEFAAISQSQKFRFVFVFLPQKDDVLYVRRHDHFYAHVKEAIGQKCAVIDMMDHLQAHEHIDDLYSDATEYGGHYSPAGNEFVAGKIHEYLLHHNIQ
jgi:hypothetical protein